ncbi:hypothetical protein LEN26_000439 [Aphanomyces euteiches]|nr:hypothetical protein AeMF1_016837 [Aphanomyces euteiches]KAH9163547.1 hypothetical protein LEN26_000439 [Aphanomyces euteiches]KAH9187529.1 hypothetical protein AeNC1_010495 [Aphanomyces euteiches]
MGFDGLVAALTPFVPPFLRVNAQTLEEIKALVPTKDQVLSLLTWKTLRNTIYFGLWTVGLVYSGELESVTLYVIVSLFVVILANLGDKEKGSVAVDENGNPVNLPSAYSVFNSRNQRLAGQLTTEHFEQQIRNQPAQHDVEEDDEEDNARAQFQEDDEDDEDLREAIRRSILDTGAPTRRLKGKERKAARRQ